MTQQKKILIVVNPHGNYGFWSDFLPLLREIKGLSIVLHDPFNVLEKIDCKFWKFSDIECYCGDVFLDASEFEEIEHQKSQIKQLLSIEEPYSTALKIRIRCFENKLYRLIRFYKAKKILKMIRPDFLISYCHYVEMACYDIAAKIQGIKVISYPYSGSFVRYYEFYRLYSDYYLASGKADYDILSRNHNIRKNQIKIIGIKKGKIKKEREVLILLNDKEFYPFWNETVLEAINFLAEDFAEIGFYVRPKNISQLKLIKQQKNLILSENESLEDSLGRARFVVSTYSTAVLKSLLYKCVTFMFLPGESFFLKDRIPWHLSKNLFVYEYLRRKKDDLFKTVNEVFLSEFKVALCNSLSFKEPDPLVEYYYEERLDITEELKKVFGLNVCDGVK